MDLPVLDAQVPHGNGWTTVAVSLADDFKANAMSNALLISPSFT